MPGFLENAGRGILGVPLEPISGLWRIDGLRQASPNIPGHNKDRLAGVAGIDGHLADGVPILELLPRLILGGNLVVVLGPAVRLVRDPGPGEGGVEGAGLQQERGGGGQAGLGVLQLLL